MKLSLKTLLLTLKQILQNLTFLVPNMYLRKKLRDKLDIQTFVASFLVYDLFESETLRQKFANLVSLEKG